MDQLTYYRYACISLMQSVNVRQLVLLYLTSCLRLRFFLDWIGNSIGNYASTIQAKMQDINKCTETLIFHCRWKLAHGEIALLYAEDISVYIWRRNWFHPEHHRKLDDISEVDCYTCTWFRQNHKNVCHLLLHLRVPDTFRHQSNGEIYSGEACFLVYLYHITKE